MVTVFRKVIARDKQDATNLVERLTETIVTNHTLRLQGYYEKAADTQTPPVTPEIEVLDIQCEALDNVREGGWLTALAHKDWRHRPITRTPHQVDLVLAVSNFALQDVDMFLTQNPYSLLEMKSIDTGRITFTTHPYRVGYISEYLRKDIMFETEQQKYEQQKRTIEKTKASVEKIVAEEVQRGAAYGANIHVAQSADAHNYRESLAGTIDAKPAHAKSIAERIRTQVVNQMMHGNDTGYKATLEFLQRTPITDTSRLLE